MSTIGDDIDDFLGSVQNLDNVALEGLCLRQVLKVIRSVLVTSVRLRFAVEVLQRRVFLYKPFDSGRLSVLAAIL